MTEMTRGVPAGATGKGKFAFLIPVVHPGGSKVSDYGVVERALRETLRSYSSQTDADVDIVVVCHQLPAWAAEFRGRVRFVHLPPHPRFAANANDVQIDKGMKYVLGALPALAAGARYVMPADGDDFVRTDFVEHVFRQDLGDHDGFIVRQGYNVLLEVRERAFHLAQVFRVQDFDRTCGTCRVLSRQALITALERLDRDLLGWTDHLAASDDGLVLVPSPALLDHLWEITTPVLTEYLGTIRVLGRHIGQGGVFAFAPLAEPLVGKACGHGNHDGPANGGNRWSGVLGCTGKAAFVRRFGLAGGAIETDGFDPGLWAGGTAFGALNRLRGRLGINSRHEKRHAAKMAAGPASPPS
jgi:hypothetical protein